MFRNAILATLLIWGTSAQAQDRAIENVIADQLQAFNDRDVVAAWDHASPTIKSIFRTPDNFGMMVRLGYPMVWDNSDVRFLDQTDLGAVIRQEVQIQGPDGGYYILDYYMVQTSEGWQIDRVSVVPAPDALS